MRQCRSENDRAFGVELMNPFTQIDARSIRQSAVDDIERKVSGLCQLQALAAQVRRRDLIARQSQCDHDHLRRITIIFDTENTFFLHRPGMMKMLWSPSYF